MELLRKLLALLTQLFGTKAVQEALTEVDNAGPPLDEHPPVPISVAIAANTGQFEHGKWSLAKYTEMHKGRMGRAITPQTLLVHTTDCKPGTFAGIAKRMVTERAQGGGFHFMIGKSEKDGVLQFCPIFVNGNHAGGHNPGGLRLPNGSIVHPNTCSVGVELDNAGRLKKDAKGWYHPDTGYRFAPEDVFVDEKGRGWEKVTEYQLRMLQLLWQALKPILKPWPEGSTVAPNATYESQGSTYAKASKPSLIGHASTNPINKTDPGPQVMAEINKWD